MSSSRSLNRYGTYDLLGNAKEWVWNESGKGLRLSMGGGWDEPQYMSAQPDRIPPMERRPDLGFRCVKSNAPPPALLEEVAFVPLRDYRKEKPVDEAAFAAIRKLYDYPPAPLRAATEATDDSDRFWRKERVSFDATYGEERVSAYLFLPRRSVAPYQAVIYYPSGIAFREKSSNRLEMWAIASIIQSGRAVLYPVLWGTYERQQREAGNREETDRLRAIREMQDVRRSVEYIDTRPDLDHRKLALLGFSAGAEMVPMALALEPRFRAGILEVGGFQPGHHRPEVDSINFAPRAKAPVLMVNGRYDIGFDVESNQKPLLNLLGAPAEDKKLVLLEVGHALVGYPVANREVLAWLDRYLGPVQD